MGNILLLRKQTHFVLGGISGVAADTEQPPAQMGTPPPEPQTHRVATQEAFDRLLHMSKAVGRHTVGTEPSLYCIVQ